MRRLTLAGLCAFALAAPPTEAPGATVSREQHFTLQVTGTEGAAFEGECRVESAGGAEVVRLSGQAPMSRELKGYFLSCSLVQTSAGGTLTIEVKKADGSVSRSRTQGQGSRITMSIR